jgi:hypothetical protein
MLNTINARATGVGDRVFAASRQLWLASLGAAVVTRDWAEKEAGPLFRNLVKEGTVVESRAVRVVGDRIEGSFARANSVWRQTRSTVTSTVKAYADSAVALVRELPRSLPKPEVVKPAKRTRKTAAGKTAVKNAKRAIKRAAKRA